MPLSTGFERCSGSGQEVSLTAAFEKPRTFRDIEVHDSTMPLSTGFERCSGSGQEVSLTAACPRSERVVFTATDELRGYWRGFQRPAVFFHSPPSSKNWGHLGTSDLMREAGLLEIEKQGQQRLYRVAVKLKSEMAANKDILDLGCCTFRLDKLPK